LAISVSPFWVFSRPTVGFSGSGGAGKTPSPENYFAGSRRVPSAAKPLSAANDVGRLPLLEQDTHARSAFFSTGKVRMILPHAMIFMAQRQAMCNSQNIR
jgi:hypothetical protein